MFKNIFVLIFGPIVLFSIICGGTSPNYADNREFTVHEFNVPHLINIIIYLND